MRDPEKKACGSDETPPVARCGEIPEDLEPERKLALIELCVRLYGDEIRAILRRRERFDSYLDNHLVNHLDALAAVLGASCLDLEDLGEQLEREQAVRDGTAVAADRPN